MQGLCYFPLFETCGEAYGCDLGLILLWAGLNLVGTAGCDRHSSFKIVETGLFMM